MPLDFFILSGTKVKDISSLRNVPLKRIYISDNIVTNVEILRMNESLSDDDARINSYPSKVYWRMYDWRHRNIRKLWQPLLCLLLLACPAVCFWMMGMSRLKYRYVIIGGAFFLLLAIIELIVDGVCGDAICLVGYVSVGSGILTLFIQTYQKFNKVRNLKYVLSNIGIIIYGALLIYCSKWFCG